MFLLCRGEKNIKIPTCYIQNDVNDFVHLIAQWKIHDISELNNYLLDL